MKNLSSFFTVHATSAALALTLALALGAQAQDGDRSGDNRDDRKSGNHDRNGDGNSGRGDDLHRKRHGDPGNQGNCPFHAKDRGRPQERKERPEPSPEQKRCMEAMRRAMQELREAHESGDLSCEEARARIAKLKERLRDSCDCGGHTGGEGDPRTAHCPFHPKERGERAPKHEGKERGDRKPRPDPDPEHKRCVEAFRRAIQELREAHDNGDLPCEEVRERLAKLKKRLENCGCGHHGGRDKEQSPRGEDRDKEKPPHRDH